MPTSEDLFAAIEAGDEDAVAALIEAEPRLATATRAGVSPARAALQRGHQDLAERLARAAAPLDVFDAAALGDLVGIFGGQLVAEHLLGISPTVYYERGWDQLGRDDIWHGFQKSVVFGTIIGLVGCYQGFQVKGGAEGVGRVTTQAVVSCILLIVAADAVLNYFLLFQ